MIANNLPDPDAPQAEQTRKVDAMSELVASMLLVDADATLPPPEQSLGTMSALRATPRPRAHRSFAPSAPEPSARGSRVTGAIVIALVIALAAVGAAAAYILTR